MNVNPLTALVGILDAARVRLLALDALRAERARAALAADAWTQRKAVHARVRAGLDTATVLLETSLSSDLRALARTDLATCATTAEQRRANAVAVLGHIAGQLDAYPPKLMADIQIRWDYADDHAWRERLASHVLTDARQQQDEGAAWYADHRDANHCLAPHVLAALQASPSLRTGLCAMCGAPVFDDRFVTTTDAGYRVAYCSTDCGADAAQLEHEHAQVAEIDERHELEVAELRATLDAADGYDRESDALDLDEVPF